MDGVIADFFGAALALWDFPPEQYPVNEWEIADVLGISVTEFWDRINATPDFWLGIKPFPWMKMLLDGIEATGIDWTIATSPSRDPGCLSQKVHWLRLHLGKKFTGYMVGSRKFLMANPRNLLIDDNDANVDNFRAHGGKAILFPALWNSRHAEREHAAATTISELWYMIGSGYEPEELADK
jgi:hypothetical protein